MDAEENSDLESAEGDFEEDDEIENADFHTEVCVICTGFVTDRGVIDSCDHWFCYECIEQWAAFSNHCPICKLGFSSITFSPVDDNTESFEGDESSLLIDDENWYLKEGEIDPLYFPANFINEENVKCLEDEECKFQSGLAAYGDFTTDTSVACDSCENWYHAICVDFDPNSKYEGGWICPRCNSSLGQPKAVIITPTNIAKNNSETETINATSASEFCGNVSVSIDDGETAVVVSFHKDPPKNEIFDKSSENKAIISDFALLSPIREIEPIMEFENKDEFKSEVSRSFIKSDYNKVEANDMNMIDAIETKEYKEEAYVVQKPTNSDVPTNRVTKRRDMQMMMEPIPVSKKSKTAPNIMSIISERTSDKKEKISGVRTKKIMRNTEQQEKKSSDLVQELQTEIKTLKNSVNDEKLLTAFRAVIAPGKSGPSGPGAKRPFAQTAQSRKNLMKKIYSTSSGRRRPSWERDCEVEFWKNKCNNSRVNQEKVETLQSILDLLKNGSKSSDNKEKGQGQNGEKKDSILSRVYLADSSVFPRKDDMNLIPLSAIGLESSSIEKSNENKVENCNKSTVVSVKKENKNVSSNSNLKEKKKENQLNGEIKKIDKRKWALEILARKNASSLEISKEKNEDLSSLKANYPLLAQLPSDMKPVLASSQRNKIPLAVRQAQLYRLSEHFLRKANLSIIRRTAETELAVADAVNIEKEICNKSNSKIVYLNLISQSLRQNPIKEAENKEIMENTEISEKNEIMELNTEMSEKREDVEELLKLTGLSSDSPPNSPCKGNDQNALAEREEKNDGNDQNALLEREKTIDSSVEKVLKLAGFSSDNSAENSPERNEEPVLVREKDELILEREKNELIKSVDQKLDSVVPKIGTSDIKPSDKVKASALNTGDLKFSETSKNSIIDKNKSNGNILERENEGCESESESCAESNSISHKKHEPVNQKLPDSAISISKKVEAYVKEHIRPLCKSGVINVGQYRWAVTKTTEKVMRFHHKDKNANFLIKEGEKVKKLAEQYVEAAQQKGDL